MTGALVAPQSLYLDKLISRFKVLSPLQELSWFLNRCSFVIYLPPQAWWQMAQQGGLGGHPRIPLPIISALPPGGSGGVPQAGEDI